MKDARSEIKETGKEQSAKAKAETGNQQANTSKRAVSGKIVGIEKIGDLIGRSISTTMDYIHLYGMPAEKNGLAVWEMSIPEFEAWAKGIGWTPQMSETELGIQVRKKDLQEAGPGKVIEGTLQHLAKRLYSDTITLNSYMKQIDCPIQKNDDGTYRVDLNKWELFQIEYRVGEYRFTGNQKGRISWT